MLFLELTLLWQRLAQFVAFILKGQEEDTSIAEKVKVIQSKVCKRKRRVYKLTLMQLYCLSAAQLKVFCNCFIYSTCADQLVPHTPASKPIGVSILPERWGVWPHHRKGGNDNLANILTQWRCTVSVVVVYYKTGWDGSTRFNKWRNMSKIDQSRFCICGKIK